MIISKNRRSSFLFLLPGIFFISFIASITFNILWHKEHFVNEPLHSTLEAFGGMAAVSMALLLLRLDKDSLREKGDYFLLAMGFFMMGIMDTCHAVSTFGNGFIFASQSRKYFWKLLVCFSLVSWDQQVSIERK